MADLHRESLSKLTVAALKDELSARNLPTSGLKDDLIERLREALEREQSCGGISDNVGETNEQSKKAAEEKQKEESALEDKLTQLLSFMTEMKAGQVEMKTEMKAGQVEMKAGQAEMKSEMKEINNAVKPTSVKDSPKKPNETLQELATDIEKLSHLAFSDCPTEVRETLAVQYFVDGVRDVEIQKALRMAETKDLKSALVYAIKFEAAQQASRRDRHFIRGAEVKRDEDPLLKVMTQLLEEFRGMKQRSGDETGKFKRNNARCWKCGAKAISKGNARLAKINGLGACRGIILRKTRRFVKGFSSIARPLHRLTENKQKFLWTDECEEAFNSLKAALTSSPILVYPDPEKQFILDTDASHESVGAVLSQEINGQEHVIAYWSKCLSKPERNYCVTRKELLAIVKAVENFHSYLYGRKFLLRTDHASLTWLLNFKNTEGQIARWIQKLEEYDFEIKHRKGSLHGNADALSRRPCSNACSYCTTVEKKYDMITPVIRQIKDSVSTQIDRWSDKKSEKPLTDPDIKPILELLESSSTRPSWQDISTIIDKTQTTPLHPQSDGMVERFNRTILNHLSIHVSMNQQDWDRKLPMFLLAYRSAVHETTGFTPSQMLFGRELRLPCDLLFGRPPDVPSSPEEYVHELQERLESVHEFACNRIDIATEKMKTRYDTRATGHEIHEGDKVWFWNPIRRKGLSPKLQTNWDGPYTVLKRLNDVVIRIQKSKNSRPRVVAL
ncbi:Retrovirus-related Pol polyprotein like [Argiope bruennichi]|uniref:Retrovirus-related Pol polyprotein like n=1 Tax=Argiope bruennichi TaxID=94029 RepID=A0A8T0EVD1_ARGBR|nr:Retrovirus-related Pol polyprotein like [Argiope bruennichi]